MSPDVSEWLALPVIVTLGRRPDLDNATLSKAASSSNFAAIREKLFSNAKFTASVISLGRFFTFSGACNSPAFFPKTLS